MRFQTVDRVFAVSRASFIVGEALTGTPRIGPFYQPLEDHLRCRDNSCKSVTRRHDCAAWEVEF
jgi:hypothetical protein